MADENQVEKLIKDRGKLDEFGLKLPTQPKSAPQPISKPKPAEEKNTK
ncbi:MAG: hypothetical protein K2X47_02000 [Bdellovibrionales bacterium]|nr:hypothetical protein [Bdellovibrionales bacterium]